MLSNCITFLDLHDSFSNGLNKLHNNCGSKNIAEPRFREVFSVFLP